MSGFSERRNQDLIKLNDLAKSTNGKVQILSKSGNPVSTIVIELNYPTVETVRKFLGYRVNDKRWTYLMSIEDKRLPLDAIYRIRNTKTVNEIKTIIDDRNVSLTLKDKQSYE